MTSDVSTMPPTTQASTRGTPNSIRTSGATPALQLRHLLTGYWVSQAVFVAAKLGVADELAGGPQTGEALARVVGADARALHRLLRALAGVGLFVEDSTGRFGVTALGTLLRRDVPGSLWALAMWNGELSYRVWGDAAYAVETGQPASSLALHAEQYAYLARNPEAAAIFQAAMGGLAREVAQAVVAAYDFTPYRRIVDVGGGHGTLLAAILQQAPAATGVLFDTPEVTATAGAVLAAAGVADRCEVAGGDFFATVPPDGDLYLLSSILHNWNDDRAQRILQTCRRAMAPGATLLLVECALPAGNELDFGKLLDLQMLVVTGGQERTVAEYAALLDSAGLRLVQTLATHAPEHVLVCTTV